MTQTTPALDLLCINALRCLSIDGVQAANSGHPGMPMGMAPAAYTLFSKHLKHNPQDPSWVNRDRFVLSAGHGSMLLYSLLHMSGYDLPLEELKNFRQWGSKTPGHPEYGHTAGVEATTGPLGQGISTAVGMAIAEQYLGSRFNSDSNELIDYNTYVIAGDGCLQEGVASEACSLAGHLGLGKLVVIYDDNNITIDGDTDLSFTEDVKARFKSYGWEVLTVEDGNDVVAIDKSIELAKSTTDKPTLIAVKTLIGYGSPNKAGSHSVHGSPLGDEEIALTKKNLGWPSEEPFFVPEEAVAHFRQGVEKGAAAQKAWEEQASALTPELSEELAKVKEGRPTFDVSDLIPKHEAGSSMASRKASGGALGALMPNLPLVLGGSADLTPSNNTHWKEAEDFQKDSPNGRYIRYGVREHAMAAIMNGINVSGLRAYGGTFLAFADYMRGAIRVAALSGYPSIFVFTHDSIGLGEDGPTHQPVETLASLRAMPNLNVIRPADANETAQAWAYMLSDNKAPSAIILSRQNLETLDVAGEVDVSKGAYNVNDVANPDVILMGTGSETAIARDAAELLAKEGITARVVSVPCWELFDKQDESYRESVLTSSVKARVAVEAAIQQGWDKYLGSTGKFIGMKGFGASAPANICFEKFGITAEAVAEAAKLSIKESN